MVSSTAATVAAYLAQLPQARRAVISAVRDLVNRYLPAGYQESMNWGMITWQIPLARYPLTYNGQPLAYAALAAQKNNYALHLMNVYADPALNRELRDGYAAAGRRLDMGKSCLRFCHVDELPMDVLARIIGATPVAQYLARYEAVRAGTVAGARGSAHRKADHNSVAVKKAAVKKVATKKVAAKKVAAKKVATRKFPSRGRQANKPARQRNPTPR